MRMRDAQFYMGAGNDKAVLAALKAAKWDKTTAAELAKHRHFDVALEEVFRWHLCFDEDDNAIGLEFWGTHLPYDLTLFAVIAPFVRGGSYLEVLGDEGELWRWVFDGKGIREVRPMITWPGEAGQP